MSKKYLLILSLMLSLMPAALAQSPAAHDSGIVLFNKAILALEHAPRLDTVSAVNVTVQNKGTSLLYQERVHFVMQKPGLFQSDVTVLQPKANAGTTYKVICDALHVWIYSPSSRQYAILSPAAFEQNDLGALGLIGSLVVGSISGQANGILDMKAINEHGGQIRESTSLVGGQQYPAVSLAGLGKGKLLKFTLNPMNAQFVQIHLTGRQQNIGYTVLEKIRSQAAPSAMPLSLFYFTPPAGVKRVKSLSIGPF